MKEKKPQKRRDCIPPEEFVALATALAITLTRGLSTAEIDSLSNFFQLLAVQIAAISSQKSFCSGEGSDLLV
ncbi:MAG: hypothetical protein ACERKO_13300 [Acetanaerobacterium sp.]